MPQNSGKMRTHVNYCHFLFFPLTFQLYQKEEGKLNRLGAVWNSENKSTLHEVSRGAFLWQIEVARICKSMKLFLSSLQQKMDTQTTLLLTTRP